MTLGEKIRKYRVLHELKQKDLGILVGFSPATADSRIRKYESDLMAPKSDIRNKLANALDVDISALSDIDIQTITDVVRVYFFFEEYLGFEIENIDFDKFKFFNEDKVHFQKREIDKLNSFIYIWQQQKKNLLSIKADNKENSIKEYELWKSRFPRDIYSYWDSIIEKIDKHYSPLVQAVSPDHPKIVYSSEFLVQIRNMIRAGLEFQVGSDFRLRNNGYLTFTFQISDLLTPKTKEIEQQFTEFLFNLKTLEEYGMVIERTVLTGNTGNTITYHLLHNALAIKLETIEEYMRFEKTKNTMNDYEIEMFENNNKKEFTYYNIDLKEKVWNYRKEELN